MTPTPHPTRRRTAGHGGARRSSVMLYVVLTVFALAFVFPFWFMAVGAFQENPTTSPADLFPTGGWTLQNFTDINSRLNLIRSLANSLIFTLGVLAGTLTFGLVAGYSLSRLNWRGRGVLFAIMLGVQAIPFQLLMIPLYVQVTRTYGLGDSYLGMILPFLINTTAVFIFRQFFLSLPESLFE
ncbi:MAG: carbohydrate ABC transporter permease, partial [Brachybacterium tyrofermentans]